MIKWMVLGAVFFFWFIAPMLFRAMINHDYNNLQNGIRSAKDAEVSHSYGGIDPNQ